MNDKYDIGYSPKGEGEQMSLLYGFAGVQVHHAMPDPEAWRAAGGQGDPQVILALGFSAVLLQDDNLGADFPPMLIDADAAALIRNTLERALRDIGGYGAYIAAYDQMNAQARDQAK